MGGCDPVPPGVDAVAADLDYIARMYAIHPSYLSIDGRFVVFVYGSTSTGPDRVRKWTDANKGRGAYLVLKAFPGYQTCPPQPDGWHEYAPANSFIDHSP